MISREWKGPPSHDPLKINPPQLDSEFVDDNHFHTFSQDLRLGASYRVTSEPVFFEPYIEYGVPASDYPFFAASSVGRNLANNRGRSDARVSTTVSEVVFLDAGGLQHGR